MVTDSSSIDEPYSALLDEGPDLTASSRRAILEQGDAATEPLVAILTDRELWDEEAPGMGWAPIHAAELLGELESVEAADVMYDILSETDPDAILDTKLTRSLRQLGEAAIEPGIEALECHGEDFRDDLACVFAGLDVDRRVVFQVLVKNLVDNPMLGAHNLAQYGDPEALDALYPMLNRLLLATGDDPSRFDEAEAVAEAIDELGGELNENQREQLETFEKGRRKSREILERVKRGERDHDHPDTHVNKHDIGRNDDCWCGSGKKYKHCHMREDQQ